MSKQRALELCDEAVRPSESGGNWYYTALQLAAAIRELSKDEPAEAIDELAKTETTTLDEVVDRLDELIKAVQELTQVCCSISKNTF